MILYLYSAPGTFISLGLVLSVINKTMDTPLTRLLLLTHQLFDEPFLRIAFSLISALFSTVIWVFFFSIFKSYPHWWILLAGHNQELWKRPFGIHLKGDCLLHTLSRETFCRGNRTVKQNVLYSLDFLEFKWSSVIQDGNFFIFLRFAQLNIFYYRSDFLDYRNNSISVLQAYGSHTFSASSSLTLHFRLLKTPWSGLELMRILSHGLL